MSRRHSFVHLNQILPFTRFLSLPISLSPVCALLLLASEHKVRWVVVPLGFKPGDSVDFPTDDGTGRTAAIVVPPGTKPGDKLKALVPPSPLKDPMAPGIAGGAATTPAATNAPTAMGGDSAARNLFDSGRGWSEAWELQCLLLRLPLLLLPTMIPLLHLLLPCRLLAIQWAQTPCLTQH